METDVDTPQEPVNDLEPQEPVEPTEPQEPIEPTEPTEPQEPQFITTDQLQQALEQQSQSFRSWLGRRDKETLGYIGNVIEERLKTVQQPQDNDDIYNDDISTQILERPREVIRSEFEAWEQERTHQRQKHLTDTMTTVASLMESDPLYEDKELGNEVVEQIKAQVQAGNLDANLPPDHAAKVVLGTALTNVLRKRKTTKTNPMPNSPTNTPTGNLQPGPKTPKLKVPKLDDYTRRMAKKWGYSEEDLAKLYGSES